MGSYRRWLALVHPDDRELLQAAVAQLMLQKQPVTYEYRLVEQERGPATPAAAPRTAGVIPLLNLPRIGPADERWVRDTMAPHLGADGQLDGWEGVLEDITEPRLLAQDLRRASNMIHALIAHLPTGVFFVHGKQGQPLLVNARARQLLGQREDLAASLNHLAEVYRLHRPDGQLYPWEELPVYQALRFGATTMRDDIVVHRPDGRKIPLVTWAAPVNLASQGEPDAAVWVLEDLTALRLAEAARKETELRLRAVIETMAEGLIVQNHAGAVVECNAAACAIPGVDADRLRTWTSLGAGGACLREDGTAMPPEEQPDRVTLKTGQPVRGVVLGIVPANSAGPDKSAVRWILANSMPLPALEKHGDNRGQRVVTTLADITAHRHALEVLRHSEEQYRGLVESMPLMLLQFNEHGALVYNNPATEEITGFHPEELARDGFWRSRVAAEDWPAFQGLLDVARRGESAHAEVRYRAADGSEQVGYALARPRRPSGTTMLVVDMTHHRHMERELEKAQRLELVGRIAGGVVHDFNNLLTVIVSYTEMAKQAVGEHPVREDLNHVASAAEQAAHLAGQLLTFSKERQVVMRRVDLNAAVAHALDLLRPTLPYNVEVELEVEPGPLWVLADQAPLQQVVMNLCLNARDAMPQGGRLTLATELMVRAEDKFVRLRVADTGAGIPAELLPRIFEPFFTNAAAAWAWRWSSKSSRASPAASKFRAPPAREPASTSGSPCGPAQTRNNPARLCISFRPRPCYN